MGAVTCSAEGAARGADSMAGDEYSGDGQSQIVDSIGLFVCVPSFYLPVPAL